MNKAKHLKIVKRALDRTEGFSNDQRAQAIVDLFEDVLFAEQEAAESGVLDAQVLRPPVADLVPPVPGALLQGLSLSPRIGSIEGRSEAGIIAPDSPEAQEIMRDSKIGKPVQPIRIGAQSETAQVQALWSIADLQKRIEQETPPVLEVLPEGRSAPVKLARNIEVLPGVDQGAAAGLGGSVKLIYTVNGMEQPRASQSNPLGEQLQAMPLDMPVTETFFCSEPNPNIQLRLHKIMKVAEQVYRPRPERIESRTPHKSGSLSFNPSDPHADTDVLKDARGNEY